MNHVVQTPGQHYYLSKLLGYDYIIVYKQGKSNKMADALSRRHSSPTPCLYLLNVPSFDLLNILSTENKTLPDLQEFTRTWQSTKIVTQISESSMEYLLQS